VNALAGPSAHAPNARVATLTVLAMHPNNEQERCGDDLAPLPTSRNMSTTVLTGLLQQREHFLRFLRRRVDSTATAEDILQSAYLRAMEQTSNLRRDESAIAWFYSTLRNSVIDYYRHRAAEDRALERWAEDLNREAGDDARTREIVCACIDDVLHTLKPTYAEILRDVDLAEGSLQAFALKAGITQSNATVRVHRARQALKKQLTLVCGTCSKHGCLDCRCVETKLS
jgi:RNA polymerase sigma factor (sigma-70 family)